MVLPTLALSFTDDPFAPRPAVEHLLDKLAPRPLRHLHLTPEECGGAMGHLGWARNAQRVAQIIADWAGEPKH